MPTLDRAAIEAMGFAFLGENVTISTLASFYGCARISIGNNVRIDDFVVFSAGAGGVVVGNNVHVAVYSSLIGAGKITLSDFSNISSRVSIYSSSDDYSGSTMTNPTIPDQFKAVMHDDVLIGRHVIIGCGTVVLPGARLNDGVAIGALSMVQGECSSFGIYAGIPAKRIKERKHDLLEIEKTYLAGRPHA